MSAVTPSDLSSDFSSTPSPELPETGATSSDHWASHARVEGEKETFASEAFAAEYLLVDVIAPRPTVRGRLSLLLDGAIERTLDACGAPPPALTAGSDFDGSLDDLIRRADVCGSRGIALWIPSLAAVVSSGVLDPEDSATLRAWLRATRDRPVKLGFHCENLPFGVHLEPLPLAALLRPEIQEMEPALVDDSGEPRDLDSESSVDRPSPTPESTETAPEALSAEDAGDDPEAEIDDLAHSARTMASELGDAEETSWLKEALMELSTPPPAASTRVPERNHTDPLRAALSLPAETPPPPRLDLAFADEPEIAASTIVVEAPKEEPAPSDEPKPSVALDKIRELEAHCRELEAATGPKPLAVVERLFAASYMPLRAALDRNPELPARLFEVAAEWSRSFEKSYTEAFDALRVRTKRPSLIADVPDLALRIARLHGARSTQLLMVDGMRFDLAELVHERLRDQVGQRAACAERFLLWAALPTTTAAQVEMLGRGAAGLKDFTGDVQSDLVVARGRKASMIRRLKAGHRELLKLDLVQARVTEPGFEPDTDLETLAEEAAQRIAAYFEGLQPRTLVMVFGDHGFVVGRKSGAAEIVHGGATPEEVLVPAFAWLVGAVH